MPLAQALFHPTGGLPAVPDTSGMHGKAGGRWHSVTVEKSATFLPRIRHADL
jgi:hypothetical protein